MERMQTKMNKLTNVHICLMFNLENNLQISPLGTFNFEKIQPTLSSQVKAVSGKLSGERLGGLSCADASGAIVAIAISVASAIVVVVVVGEMLGEMWWCRPETSGAIRAANRQ